MEYEEWQGLDLTNLEVVYQWADGIYVKAGLEKDKAALLIIIGALTTGKKVFLACESGYRESKESWSGVLRGLTSRGLKLGSLTVADGHLGIWSALAEIHPKGNEQRCWNHKIRNVLDALPKRIRAEASEQLKRIPYAESVPGDNNLCLSCNSAFQVLIVSRVLFNCPDMFMQNDENTA